jgi:RNA polymerase sigma-70 factor, ECF subfamily
VRTIFPLRSWKRRQPPLSPEAFSQLCQEHLPNLLRLARRLTRGNEDPAQDLVQETLIRAFEAFGRDGYNEQGNLRAYLMRILTNYFLSQQRRERRSVSLDIEEVTGEHESTPKPLVVASPESRFFNEHLDEPLERALEALPEGIRTAILLVDLEGLEYKEAALALGIPVGTVRSRLFRGRQLLHEVLLSEATTNGWLSEKQDEP